jgi:2',5'-phosphodiesterase
MSRGVEEPMSSFLERLEANLNKVLERKNKKNKKLKTSEDASEEIATKSSSNVDFFLNDTPVSIDTESNAKDFLFRDGLQMKILSAVFDVEVNPPIMLNARLPDTIMAGFIVYPFKQSLTFANIADSEYVWYVSEPNLESNKVESPKTIWTKRHVGFFYSTTNDDINRYIKLEVIPKLGDRCGGIFPVISKNAVTAGPGSCPFEERHLFTQDKLGDPGEFRTVTYNLLADLYADSDFSRTVLHPQCPPYALAIAYRKSLFVKELVGYNADIMCLQEVDNKVFDGDLFPVFSAKGYDGVFDRKGGTVSEGAACFWNAAKFSKLDSSRMVLGEAVIEDPKFEDIKNAISANDKLKESFIGRTTALQTVILESCHDKSRGLVIGTTHLYFKPDADHIRLLQIAMIMRELEAAVQAGQKNWPEKKFSLLLCGDFNSTPTFGVLEFMKTKTIGNKYPDWSSAGEDEQVKDLSINHSFNMNTACGTPKYTTYTIGFKDCIDYIFYQTDDIQVTNVVPFPLEEELKVHQGLPNIVFPSDHIACIADLKWI